MLKDREKQEERGAKSPFSSFPTATRHHPEPTKRPRVCKTGHISSSQPPHCIPAQHRHQHSLPCPTMHHKPAWGKTCSRATQRALDAHSEPAQALSAHREGVLLLLSLMPLSIPLFVRQSVSPDLPLNSRRLSNKERGLNGPRLYGPAFRLKPLLKPAAICPRSNYPLPPIPPTRPQPLL